MGFKKIKILTFFLTICFIAVPFIASAALLPTIVPCTGATGENPCDICDLAQLTQNILNAAIYITVFLSAVLFAWAGWKYVTAGGDTGKATQAREVFTNVIIGLVIVLAGWLIVDTIMGQLVKDSSGFGPWRQICPGGGGGGSGSIRAFN